MSNVTITFKLSDSDHVAVPNTWTMCVLYEAPGFAVKTRRAIEHPTEPK